MTNCIADIESWCRYLVLKLNTDKSEVQWLGTRQQIAKLSQADYWDMELALQSGALSATLSMNEWNEMNENARILSAFENRLRVGFV